MQFLLCFQVPLRLLLLLDLLLEPLQLFLDLLNLLLRLKGVLLNLELGISDFLDVDYGAAIVGGISSGGGKKDCIDVRVMWPQGFPGLDLGHLGGIESLLGLFEPLEFLILLALLSSFINRTMPLLLNQGKIKGVLLR